MIELPTEDEKKLKALQEKLRSVVMYSEEWFVIKEKYTKLFQKIERTKGTKG